MGTVERKLILPAHIKAPELGEFMGFKIGLDPAMPNGEVQLRSSDGSIVGLITAIMVDGERLSEAKPSGPHKRN
jgi:hypothetical protein